MKLIDNKYFRYLDEELKLLQSGAIVVASTGNKAFDTIQPDLNNGSSIMVGSHNHSDEVSDYSNSKCKANISSLGEDIFFETIEPNIQSGTSFAAPHVTAAVANFFSLVSPSSEQRKHPYIINNILKSADMLTCKCHIHNAALCKIEMNPTEFVRSCLELESQDSRKSKSLKRKLSHTVEETPEAGDETSKDQCKLNKSTRQS